MNTLESDNRIELTFMIVPEQLATLAKVPDPIRVKIIDPEAIFLTGILGESGRKLVQGGVHLYFTRSLAEKLIEKKIAVQVPEPLEVSLLEKLANAESQCKMWEDKARLWQKDSVQQKEFVAIYRRAIETLDKRLIEEMKKDKSIMPNAVKMNWVKCPICGEPDMRQEEDAEGNKLILCVNHACASNGGDNNIEAENLDQALTKSHHRTEWIISHPATFAELVKKHGSLLYYKDIDDAMGKYGNLD